jgi:hypothetical protein
MQDPLLKQAPGLYAFFKPNTITLFTLICSLALLAQTKPNQFIKRAL